MSDVTEIRFDEQREASAPKPRGQVRPLTQQHMAIAQAPRDGWLRAFRPRGRGKQKAQ